MSIIKTRSQLIAVFSRMRGNKFSERLAVQDSNTPHLCDYRYKKLERDRQFFRNVPKNINYHSLETIKAKTLEILSQIYFADSLLSTYNVITLFKNHPNMGATIRTKIIKIGNSQGIRIPKILLEQSGINTEVEVEIEVESDRLTVRPAQQRRIGWDKAFAEMAENQDDILLDEINTTDWDQNEWEW